MLLIKTLFINLAYNIYSLFFIIRLYLTIRLHNHPYELTNKSGENFIKKLAFFKAKINIEKLNTIRKEKMTSTVIVSNHMSFLETFVIPYLLNGKTIFVAKKELTRIPFFNKILRSINTIFIARKSAKKDLVTVLREGARRLKESYNIVIFPQGGRRDVFDPKEFNTLGLRLALKADVPISIIAVKTDFLRSFILPNIGFLKLKNNIHFEFGPTFKVNKKNMAKVHNECKSFIDSKLNEWKNEKNT